MVSNQGVLEASLSVVDTWRLGGILGIPDVPKIVNFLPHRTGITNQA